MQWRTAATAAASKGFARKPVPAFLLHAGLAERSMGITSDAQETSPPSAPSRQRQAIGERPEVQGVRRRESDTGGCCAKQDCLCQRATAKKAFERLCTRPNRLCRGRTPEPSTSEEAKPKETEAVTFRASCGFAFLGWSSLNSLGPESGVRRAPLPKILLWISGEGGGWGWGGGGDDDVRTRDSNRDDAVMMLAEIL